MPNKKYEELFRNKLNKFNSKYKTNLKVSSFAKMNDAMKSFYVNGMEQAKCVALNDYKNEYKKLLTKTLSQDTLLTKPEAFNELVEILDTEVFYLTDLVEKYGDSSNTLTNVDVTINENGKYISSLDIDYDMHKIVTTLENNYTSEASEANILRTMDGQNQLINKSYYNVHEWLNELEDSEDNKKKVPFLNGGALSKKEKNEIVNGLFKKETKEEHYEFINLIEVFIDTDTFHYENMEEKANLYLDYYDRTKKVATGDEKDRLITFVAPVAQMLIDKRESRSWLNAILHPFDSHGETMAINRIVGKFARAIGEDFETLKRDLKENRIEVFDGTMQNAINNFKTFSDAEIKSSGDMKLKFQSLEDSVREELKLEPQKEEVSDFEKNMAELKNKSKALKEENIALEDAYYQKHPEQIRVQVEVEPEALNDNNEEMLDLIKESGNDVENEIEIDDVR